MQSSDLMRLRKSLAGLVGYLARGPAALVDQAENPRRKSQASPARLELIRDDGARRKVDPRLLKMALENGLIAAGSFRSSSPGKRQTYAATSDGRAALRRWLADPQTAFQDQHRRLATASDPEHGSIVINDNESPLAALARIKGRGGGLFLEPSQVEAGERLRVDFTRGQMQPSIGQSWEPVRYGRRSGATGGSAELGEAALSARLRVEAAMDAVGPELCGVLLDVCCFLKGLAEVERERQWPARSAKLMLRTALRHWPAIMPGRGALSGGRPRRRRMRLDPQDHRAQPVGPLCREMFTQAQLRHQRAFIEFFDFRCLLARGCGQNDGDEAAHDMGVRIAPVDHHRIAGLTRFGLRNQPDLAGAALDLVLVCLFRRRHLGKCLADLDDIAVAVFPVVKILEIVDDGLKFGHWVFPVTCQSYRRI
jgi:hypothetical protein